MYVSDRANRGLLYFMYVSDRANRGLLFFIYVSDRANRGLLYFVYVSGVGPSVVYFGTFMSMMGPIVVQLADCFDHGVCNYMRFWIDYLVTRHQNFLERLLFTRSSLTNEIKPRICTKSR